MLAAPQAAVVVEAAAAALAANEADITRYPDEKTSAGSTLTTEGPAELRTEVGSGGKLVVVLKKGTEVANLAEHAGHNLVVAEDPKDASRKLMGWAGASAFTLPAVHVHEGHEGHEAHEGGAPAGDAGAHAASAGDAAAPKGAAPAKSAGH